MRSASLAIFLALLVACGSTPGTSSSPSPAGAGTNRLLGEWHGTRSCDAVLDAFREAGLTGRLPGALVDARYFANEGEIDRDDPCRGAEQTAYLYFFEDPDRWGLVDDDDVLVEDRTYTVVDEDTVAFDGIDVDHRVEGDTLTFDVQRPAACDAPCMETYVWALATFAPATLERAA